METSGTFKFQANVPAVVALKYSTGRAVVSQFNGEDQVMFSLVNGQKMYLSPFVAGKIDALDLNAGESFLMCKREVISGNRKQVEWQVQRNGETSHEEQVAEIARTRSQVQQIAAPAVDPTPAVPAPAPVPDIPASQTPSTAARFEHALKTAILAARNAEAYAAEIGYSVRFDQESIRCMGNTVLINLEGGRR